MKLFIDTNVLLDMYHLSSSDLNELRKLVDRAASGELSILMPQQVVDEFWRNREGVIADALKRFRETRAQATIPNVVRTYAESEALRAAVSAVGEAVKQLEAQVRHDIETGELLADGVINALFAAAKPVVVPEEVIARATRRADVGNPPGKKGSLGDAINWEWLLAADLADTDVVVVLSNDGDFESELVKGQMKEFLLREWNTQNPGCEIRLEKSLTGFLQAYAPDIELTDEVEKEAAIQDLEKLEAIEELEEAGAFRWVHRAVRLLSAFDDFTDSEVRRLLRAYLDNDQVYMIARDDDVLALANRLIALAKSEETIALAAELRALIGEPDEESF